MRRTAAGIAAAGLLLAAGVMFWRSDADANDPLPSAPAERGAGTAEPADPPRADEKTREERRFGRYDKDENGAVTRDEYLASRRKAYAKLDGDGDGRLTFDEWAKKTTDKFARADADASGALTATEFATTRVVRKSAPKCACPPAREEDD